MVKDKGHGTRAVKSLTLRISLSLLLFTLLMLGTYTGLHIALAGVLRLEFLYEPVHKNKQSQPDYVNEVPIPRHALKTKMVLGGKVSRHYPAPNDQQHDGAQRDMEAVEPGQHVERCAIRTGGHLKVEIRISMAVLICLQAHKQKAQRKSEKKSQLELSALVQL